MIEPTMSLPDVVSVGEDEADTLGAKLTDVLTPGFVVEFDPVEAEQAGAFLEDALSERDAAESDVDVVDATAPAVSGSAEH
jgi:hypothetical protein